MQKISDEYEKQEYIVRPGHRFHRLIALLHDTYYDDVTDERIRKLETEVEGFRWMTAGGERVDKIGIK